MRAAWIGIFLLCGCSWAAVAEPPSDRGVIQPSQAVEGYPEGKEKAEHHPIDNASLLGRIMQSPSETESDEEKKKAADYYAQADLIQYKRAADAGRDQAEFAKRAWWLSIVGMVLLALGYLATRKTLQTTLRTERPYLFFNPLKFSLLTSEIKTNEKFGIDYQTWTTPVKPYFECEIENYGRTPAIIRSIDVVMRAYEVLPEKSVNFWGEDENLMKILAAGKKVNQRKTVFDRPEIYDSDKEQMFVMGRIIYETTIGMRCETRLCLNLSGTEPKEAGGKAYNYRK